MAPDRSQADLGKRPFDRGRIVDCRSNAVKTAEEKHRGGDRREYGENSDQCQEGFHAQLHEPVVAILARPAQKETATPAKRDPDIASARLNVAVPNGLTAVPTHSR